MQLVSCPINTSLAAPRLFAPGGVAPPRHSTRYASSARLARHENSLADRARYLWDRTLEGITDGHDQCLWPETDVSGTDDASGIGMERGLHLRDRIGSVQVPMVRDIVREPRRADRSHRRGQRKLGGAAARGVALGSGIPIVESGVVDAGADVGTPL